MAFLRIRKDSKPAVRRNVRFRSIATGGTRPHGRVVVTADSLCGCGADAEKLSSTNKKQFVTFPLTWVTYTVTSGFEPRPIGRGVAGRPQRVRRRRAGLQPALGRTRDHVVPAFP